MFVAIKYNISVNLYYLGHFIVCLLQLNTIFPLIYIIFGDFIVCSLQLNTIFPLIYIIWDILLCVGCN